MYDLFKNAPFRDYFYETLEEECKYLVNKYHNNTILCHIDVLSLPVGMTTSSKCNLISDYTCCCCCRYNKSLFKIKTANWLFVMSFIFFAVNCR